MKNPLLLQLSHIVLAFMILLPLNIGELDKKYESNKTYNLQYRLFLVVIMLIPIGLSLYSINCMVSGKCVMWSYINAIFICIWVLLFVIAAILANR